MKIEKWRNWEMGKEETISPFSYFAILLNINGGKMFGKTKIQKTRPDPKRVGNYFTIFLLCYFAKHKWR